MKAPVDKSPDNQRKAAAHEAPQQQDRSDAECLFIDNRAETASLRQLQEVADNSPPEQGLSQLKAMMHYSPRSTSTQNLQAMIDKSPRQAAQQQEHSRVQGAPMSLQAGSDDVSVQRVEEDELSQGEFVAESPAQLAQPPDAKPNNTGLPDNLKAGVESLSGLSLDDVKVHYNSSEPAQLNAHAYAQGTDIHVGPGQEQHLPHEAWHVVQQAQGRVQPTMQMKDGVEVNDDQGLEREADLKGTRALSSGVVQATQKLGSSIESDPIGSESTQTVVQPVRQFKGWNSVKEALEAIGYSQLEANAIRKALSCAWDKAAQIMLKAAQVGLTKEDLLVLANTDKVTNDNIGPMLDFGLRKVDVDAGVDIEQLKRLEKLGMNLAHYQAFKVHLTTASITEIEATLKQGFTFDYIQGVLEGTPNHPAWPVHNKILALFGAELYCSDPLNLCKLMPYKMGKANLKAVLVQYINIAQLLDVCTAIQKPEYCKTIVESVPLLKTDQAYWEGLHTHRVALGALLKLMKATEYLSCRVKGHFAPNILQCYGDYDVKACVSMLSIDNVLNTVAYSDWLHNRVVEVKKLLASGGAWTPCILQMAAFNFSAQQIEHMLLFEEKATIFGNNTSHKFHEGTLSIRIGHYAMRHTFHHFNFGLMGDNNSLWPASIVNSENNLIEVAEFVAKEKKDSPDYKGCTIQWTKGTWDNKPAITQLFPSAGPGVVNYTRAQMLQFKTVIDLKPVKK